MSNEIVRFPRSDPTLWNSRVPIISEWHPNNWRSQMELWYDPSDENNVIKGGDDRVSLVYDLSPSGFNAVQIFAAAEPLWNGDSQNGLPVLQWGTGDYMDILDSSALNPGVDPFVVCVVCRSYTSSSETAIIQKGNTLSNIPGWSIWMNVASPTRFNVRCADTGEVLNRGSQKITLTTSPVVLTMYMTGNTIGPSIYRIYGYQNGSSTGWSSGGGGPFNNNYGPAGVSAESVIRFGDWSAAGFPSLNGWIGEILIYRREMSNIDLQNLHNYMMAKWGIS